MARTSSVTKRRRTGSAENQVATSKGTCDELNQKISDAYGRLEELGKSPADVIAFFQVLRNHINHGGDDFGVTAAAAQWSPEQIWTAIELICLCALSSSVSIVAIREAALWYTDTLERRFTETIGDILPDYRRGNKVRESGAQNHGAPEDRFRRCDQLRAIYFEIVLDLVKKKRSSNSLSKIELNKRVATTYTKRYRKKITYKTVERDFANRRNLLKKLDEPGLSR
jgi:hypothetical protein